MILSPSLRAALKPALDNEIDTWDGADCGEHQDENDRWVAQLKQLRRQLDVPQDGDARGLIVVVFDPDMDGHIRAGIVADATIDADGHGRDRWRVLLEGGDELIVWADDALVIDDDRCGELYERLREDRKETA